MLLHHNGKKNMIGYQLGDLSTSGDDLSTIEIILSLSEAPGNFYISIK